MIDPPRPLYTAYLDGSLRLTRQGVWLHEGRKISNRNLSDLFHRSVVWDDTLLRYVVRIGKEQATFTCDDAPYYVVALDTSHSPWELVLAGGERAPLDRGSLRQTATHELTSRIKGGHRALFLSGAYQIMVEHTIDDRSICVDGEVVTIAME